MSRFSGMIDEFKKQNKELEKKVKEMQRRRAEIRDEGGKAEAGALVPGGSGINSVKELQEVLRLETVRRGNNALRARIAQIQEEMRKEVEKLKEENEAIEQEMGEPLSLTLIAPANGDKVKKSAENAPSVLEIKWSSTGLVADKLRVALLSNGQLIKMLSPEAPRRKGSYSWLMPQDFPLGEFQIVLQDAVSGLSSGDDVGKFKIT